MDDYMTWRKSDPVHYVSLSFGCFFTRGQNELWTLAIGLLSLFGSSCIDNLSTSRLSLLVVGGVLVVAWRDGTLTNGSHRPSVIWYTKLYYKCIVIFQLDVYIITLVIISFFFLVQIIQQSSSSYIIIHNHRVRTTNFIINK